MSDNQSIILLKIICFITSSGRQLPLPAYPDRIDLYVKTFCRIGKTKRWLIPFYSISEKIYNC